MPNFFACLFPTRKQVSPVRADFVLFGTVSPAARVVPGPWQTVNVLDG